MTVTRTLAAFAVETPADAIPPAVTQRALDLGIDLIGSGIRAANEMESTPAVQTMLARLGMDGPEACTVFGLSRRYGAAAAALQNAMYGHSLDFDDTHADSSLHPSAPVVPAAFAAAELTGASGTDLLSAIVVGIETCCKLGMALDPTSHYARGFHPTATAGNFGAAAAAGRLLGLDVAHMEAAFGVAASQASGSLQFLENGAWNKRYQVGEAAMKGVIAATLAAEGFVGASNAVDGPHGFLTGYSDAADPAIAVAGLGETWETMRIGIKPYPACRYIHAAVDGLLSMMQDRGWQPEDITQITVGLHRNGITLVGAPLAEKRRARSIVEGQFSMPYAAAVALLRGRFGWDDYDLLGDPAAEALADRVEVVRDETLEGLRHPFGATLRITTRGEELTARIVDPSGEPETFPTKLQLTEKFTALAGPFLIDPNAVLADLRGLAELSDVRAMCLSASEGR
jgi:2-methylcitrate dehydratase PrpD